VVIGCTKGRKNLCFNKEKDGFEGSINIPLKIKILYMTQRQAINVCMLR
jgi:hypothetical protein